MKDYKLFEYAILYFPARKKEKPEIIKDLERVIATSEQEVVMIAAKQIPAEYDDKLDQIEFVIRSF